jgi:hypothetical protein
MYLEGFDGFVTSTSAPIATGWSARVRAWELHPPKIVTFFQEAHRSLTRCRSDAMPPSVQLCRAGRDDG